MEESESNPIPEHLKSYRDSLQQTYDKSNGIFETQLSFISAGALGLTFVVIEKVIKDIPAASCKGFLIMSWIFLSLTLIANLLSHPFTSNCHYKTIDEINNNKYNPNLVSKRNKQINNINIICVIFLIIGISSFIFYTSYNVINTPW